MQTNEPDKKSTNFLDTQSFRIAERLAARLATKKKIHTIAMSQGVNEVVMECEFFWNDSDEAALAAFELHMNQLLGIDNGRN
jgi:hypothetical protein